MKLLCIDGNSIINRAYYGIKLLSTKDGQYTNGIYGFINTLNQLCDRVTPEGVAVAFDLKAPTFRHKMYGAYKAGRKGMPDELASQMPLLKQWLTYAGYRCVELAGYEADDILGTFAALCEKNGDKCYIATGDRDSLQLVSDTTTVLLTATKAGKAEITEYTKEKLFEDYGLTPAEMIEHKSLMGDSSDNIPGVAGIGKVTSQRLISTYHSIDYIYDNIDTIDVKEGERQKLIAGRQSAFLSRELGTICREVPLEISVEDCVKKSADTENLARLMTRLELFKLMEKMGIEAGPNYAMDLSDDAEKPVFTVKPFSEFKEDTVTLFCADNLYFAVGKNSVYQIEENDFKNLLSNKNIAKKVYDNKNLCKQYESVENICFDAMLAGYLCNPSSSSYTADRLSAEYGAVVPEVIGQKSDALISALAFADTCEKLETALKNSGQYKLLTDIEIPLSRVLANMEKVGFSADAAGLKNMGEELDERINEIAARIFELIGYEFNLNSPKQLGVALFEKLGLPCKKKTKNGYSTNAEVLEELKSVHPAVELLLKYRQLAKLKSTYCDGLLNSIGTDGRIHSTFNQTEARTGRISSLEPNLQNIPVRTEEGKRLREFFVAKPGCVLCDADYSQIELRVLASVSGDENMINAFKNNVDIHTVTASQVFGMPTDMVTPLMRSRAKAVNFGIVYGIGAFSLSKDIGVTLREAKNYITNYLATYKGVAKYMDDTIEKAKQNGFVTTYFGRRRYLPELSSSNGMLRKFGERAARNAPIQGTAADIIKIAMVRVYDRLKREVPSAELILQVHDELIAECRAEDAKTVSQILAEEMQKSADFAVPFTADAHYGKNWLEAKG